MKISSKAAVYSGLVFPGSGYFIVHCNKRAIAFILATFVCLAFIMYEAYYKAQIIAQGIIDSGVIPTSISQLREQIVITPGILTPFEINSIYAIIGLIWLIGLIDSYRVALSLERKADNPNTGPD